jgi:thioredoxin 1
MALTVMVIPVNELNFEQEVLRSSTPVLIDVSTRWCPPCRVAQPVIHALASEHAGRLKVVEIDGDECPELVARLGVRGFPTFIIYAGGKPCQRQAGFGGKAALQRMVREIVAANPGV